MNILFMTSPQPTKCESHFDTYEKRPPLGLGYLISILRNEGHQVFFIDHYLNELKIDYSEYLDKNCIDYVGISINTACFEGAKRHISKIQKIREEGKWNGKIFVGGPHASIALETIPEYIDHIIIGEGEEVILDVINGTKERIIKGHKIEDMDALPYPAWDVFSKLPYDNQCMWTAEKPVFTMNTSRGCPFGCSFCSVEAIWGKSYTSYSPERMLGEVQHLMKKFGARVIYFREDNFTVNRKRVEEFCKLIKEKNIFIKWACETRVDTLDKSLIEIMAQSGCIGLFIGVESGSQRVLDMMNKRITLDQIRNVFKWCKETYIKTYASFITGFPDETIEDLVLTRKFIKEINPDIWSINVFFGMPGSTEYKKMIEKDDYAYKAPNGVLYNSDYNIRTRFLYGESRTFIPYYAKGKFGNELDAMKNRVINRVNSLLETVRINKSNFCIYGAGKQTKELLQSCNFTGVEITAVFDSDIEKQGKTINNVFIYSPEKILEVNPDIILISVTVPIEEVYSQLKCATKGTNIYIVRLYEENELYVLNEAY